MKSKILIVLITGVIITLINVAVTSIIIEENYLKKEYYHELSDIRHDLIYRCNQLETELSNTVHKYNRLSKEYESLEYESSELKRLKNDYNELKNTLYKVKGAVRDLNTNFDYFLRGKWYDANDIRRQIRNIYDELD